MEVLLADAKPDGSSRLTAPLSAPPGSPGTDFADPDGDATPRAGRGLVDLLPFLSQGDWQAG